MNPNPMFERQDTLDIPDSEATLDVFDMRPEEEKPFEILKLEAFERLKRPTEQLERGMHANISASGPRLGSGLMFGTKGLKKSNIGTKDYLTKAPKPIKATQEYKNTPKESPKAIFNSKNSLNIQFDDILQKSNQKKTKLCPENEHYLRKIKLEQERNMIALQNFSGSSMRDKLSKLIQKQKPLVEKNYEIPTLVPKSRQFPVTLLHKSSYDSRIYGTNNNPRKSISPRVQDRQASFERRLTLSQPFQRYFLETKSPYWKSLAVKTDAIQHSHGAVPELNSSGSPNQLTREKSAEFKEFRPSSRELYIPRRYLGRPQVNSYLPRSTVGGDRPTKNSKNSSKFQNIFENIENTQKNITNRLSSLNSRRESLEKRLTTISFEAAKKKAQKEVFRAK